MSTNNLLIRASHTITPPSSPTPQHPPPLLPRIAVAPFSREIDWADEAPGDMVPWCNYCHPDSGCDGDHGDECRESGGGGPIYRGPIRFDTPPIHTQATNQLDVMDDLWERDLNLLLVQCGAIRESPLSSFAPINENDEANEELEIDMDAA